jgi:hypothetical protein
MNPNKTIDLKTLENGQIFDFGLAELEAGHYNQMRLKIGSEPEPVEPIDNVDIQHPQANYLVIEGNEEDSEEIEILKVPSGFQTGIKVVKGFEIVNQGTTALILDFHANKSVVKAGNSGHWLLKPTIKVLKTVENFIYGTVVDNTDSPIPGAKVNAQIFDSEDSNVKYEDIVESTTITTAEGKYKFFLPPDVYNVVVKTDNYLTACKVVEALYYEGDLADFQLEPRDTGTDITLTVNVTDLDEGESAFLHIRQPNFECALNESETISTTIEVASDHVQNGSYDFILPAGTYNLVAYTKDETIEFTGENSTGAIDVAFTPTP